MARPSDVVLGLEVGPWFVQAGAFDLDGAGLGGASLPLRPERSAAGAMELDPIRLWQTVVEAMHGLARAVPDLGRRAVALGITGNEGGLCLVDEDGEPTRPLVTAFEPAGPAPSDLQPASALLKRLSAAAPAAAVDHAAAALDLRGWVLACLTGEVLQVPPYQGGGVPVEALAEPAFLRPPEAVPWRPLALRPAAAAVSGLWDGTPVVVAPPAPVAAAIAAGLADPAFDGGVALLGTEAWLVRGDRQGCPAVSGWGSQLAPLQLQRGDIGGAALDWLRELAQNLLAEAGLIGLTRDEFAGLLQPPAAGRGAGRLRFRRSGAGERGPWTLEGVGAAPSLAEIAAAIHEAIGRSCRAAFEATGGLPTEVRLAGALAPSGPLQEILDDRLAVPLRLLARPSPAACGAALCALRAIGEIDALDRATARWVEPFLGPPLSRHPAQPAARIEAAGGVLSRDRR